MGGDERLRLFCALQLPGETVEAIAGWQREHLQPEHVHGGRVVPAENLHITLVFLGSRPLAEVPAIAAELRGAADAAEPATFELRGYRETPRVGMLVLAGDRREPRCRPRLRPRAAPGRARAATCACAGPGGRTSRCSASASGQDWPRRCRTYVRFMSSGRPSTVPRSAEVLLHPVGRGTTHSKQQP